MRRLSEFGAMLKRRYGHPLDAFLPMEKTSENEWTIGMENYEGQKFNEGASAPLVNRVVVMEDMTQGEAVCEFRVWANLPCYRSKRVCVYKGETIGHKAICAFPTIRTGKITVEVTKSNGEAVLRDIKAYYAM